MQGTNDRGEVVGCSTCGLVQEVVAPPSGHVALCARCGDKIVLDPRPCLNRVLALAISGLILYVPSNAYPVLQSTLYGAVQDTTIWSGMTDLYKSGAWPIALVVLFASICVPLTKLLGLLFLVVTYRWRRGRLPRTRLYLVIAKIGKWSMLDVFVVSITVTIVQFGQISTTVPMPGVVAFAGVVVVTLLASMSFDPRVLWLPTRE
jgi:paraquat-inducible protein A